MLIRTNVFGSETGMTDVSSFVMTLEVPNLPMPFPVTTAFNQRKAISKWSPPLAATLEVKGGSILLHRWPPSNICSLMRFQQQDCRGTKLKPEAIS